MPYELTPRTAMNKLWSSLDSSPFVMVGTAGDDYHSEPLTAYFDEEFPNRLFFFVKKDNRLVNSLTGGRTKATATFQSKGHNLFACLHGQLSSTTDTAIRDRFWSKNVAAWFSGGKDDPMLQMLMMDLHDVELWDADLSVRGKLKMAFGGTVNAEELGGKHVKAKL